MDAGIFPCCLPLCLSYVPGQRHGPLCGLFAVVIFLSCLFLLKFLSAASRTECALAGLFPDSELLQGDPIFIDDHVLILQDSTSADLGANDGHTGIVVSASSAENPLFVVKLDSTKEEVSIPRTRLRLMTHEDGVSYRQDLGFGRGQRVSREVERTDKVDFSKMTDKQFDKHMREADKEEDEVWRCLCPCVRVCARGFVKRGETVEFGHLF
jgi:hypothetical protein